jgi:Ku70/Ku80 beta-barrel domain
MFTRIRNDDPQGTTTTTDQKMDDTTVASSSTSSSSWIVDCMNAIQTVIRNKIRMVTIYKAGKRDGIGVVLYNTKYRTTAAAAASNSRRPKAGAGSDDEMEEDEEDEDLLYSHDLSPLPYLTNVHEFLPFEPPGVSTIQRLKSVTSKTTPSSSDPCVDLEQEYCSMDLNNADHNQEETSPDGNSGTFHNLTLPPLLLALRKAVDLYSNAPCVKKTRKTSAGKWEEPDVKHIWIITPNDDPCRRQFGADKNGTTTTTEQRKEMLRVLQECASDINENDIQVHVWPILVNSSNNDDSTSPSFDSSIFYNSITTTEAETNNHAITTSNDWVQKLDAVYKKTRPAYRVPFLLPNWQKHSEQSSPVAASSSRSDLIYLDFYSLQAKQKDPSVIPIHQSTGKVLGKIRQLLTLDDGGGHILAESRSFDSKKSQTANKSHQQRLRTYLEFGNELIPFSMRDKIAIKKQCNINPDYASLVLLGFKPSTSVPFYHTIEKSYFAYPSSSSSSSSNRSSINTIANLHSAMIRKDVVAIGELLTRVTATSRLVVIRPLPEELRQVDNENTGDDDDDDDVWMLIRPPGLLITALPFEDELRAASADESTMVDENAIASEELVRATVNLVQKQSFVDAVEIGDDFVNAAMSRFWNYIEHVAYNEDVDGTNKVSDDIQYDTEVNVEQVLKHSGEEIEAVLSLLPEDLPKVKAAATARKRKVTSVQQPSDDSGIDWFKVVQDGELSRCKVPDLKSKLRSLGLPVTGNKSVVSTLLDNTIMMLEICFLLMMISDVFQHDV